MRRRKLTGDCSWCGGPRGGCDRCIDEACPWLSCRSVALASRPVQVDEPVYLDGLIPVVGLTNVGNVHNVGNGYDILAADGLMLGIGFGAIVAGVADFFHSSNPHGVQGGTGVMGPVPSSFGPQGARGATGPMGPR